MTERTSGTKGFPTSLIYAFRHWMRFLASSVSRREINKSAAALHCSSGRIPGALELLEGQYLVMSRKLAELGPATRELVERGGGLAKLASGQDRAKAHIERAGTLIQGFLDRLTGMQLSLAALIADLREADRGIRLLLRSERKLADAIAPLDYVQVMLKIEAARLPADRQEVFDGLAGEIAEVCLRTKESCETNIESLSRLEDHVRGAIDGVEKRQCERQTALESSREETARVLRQLSADIQKNEGRERAVTAATSGLAIEVNHAVIALQTQDIVAQRLAHAKIGLLDAEAAARRYAGSQRETDALKAKALLRVESEQILSIGDDMTRAGAEISRTTESLQNHLRAFQADSRAWREFAGIGDSFEGTVQVLLDSFAKCRELLSDFAASIGEAEALVRPCEAMAGKAISSVQTISAFMRLIALNGQIHAIKIGDGTGLEILAAHTSAISTATTEIGVDTGQGAERLSGYLRSGTQKMAALRTAFEGESARIHTDADAEETFLREFRASARGEMHELTSAMQTARSASEGLLVHADCEPIQTLLEELRDCAMGLEILLESRMSRPPRDLAGFAAGLRSRYTMSRERAAHDRAFGAETQELVAMADSDNASTLAAEGVELF